MGGSRLKILLEDAQKAQQAPRLEEVVVCPGVLEHLERLRAESKSIMRGRREEPAKWRIRVGETNERTLKRHKFRNIKIKMAYGLMVGWRAASYSVLDYRPDLTFHAPREKDTTIHSSEASQLGMAPTLLLRR